jgi:HEAT repeat protein
VVTSEQAIRRRLRSRVNGPALSDYIAQLERDGASFLEALRRIVETPGLGRYFRGGAAAALKEAGHPEVIEFLISEFLREPEKNCFWEAAQSLEEMGDKRATAAFVRALNDPDQEHRYAAAHVLGWMKDKRAVMPLIRVLEDQSQPPFVRGEAAESLSYLRSFRPIPALIRALGEDHVAIRFWSVFALGSIRDRETWKGGTNDPRVVPALESVLEDTTVLPTYWSVGREALAMLGRLTPTNPDYKKRLAAELNAVLDDPDACHEDRSWAHCFSDG